jgi:hypothetical protein
MRQPALAFEPSSVPFSKCDLARGTLLLGALVPVLLSSHTSVGPKVTVVCGAEDDCTESPPERQLGGLLLSVHEVVRPLAPAQQHPPAVEEVAGGELAVVVGLGAVDVHTALLEGPAGLALGLDGP